MSKEHQAAVEAANRAQVDAASAQGQLDDLRHQAEADQLKGAPPPAGGGIVSAIGKALWWASTPIRYPLTIAGELIFGVGQSPEEIMTILLQGRTNIQLLRSHLGAVKRAEFDQQRKLTQLRTQLNACLKANAAPGVDVPAQQPTEKAA